MPPFTESYKYCEAMKCIDPILEKLKSCGRWRLCELLRKFDAFADKIINGTPSSSHDQSTTYSAEVDEDEADIDEGSVVTRYVMRREGIVSCAHAGFRATQRYIASQRPHPRSTLYQAIDSSVICSQEPFI
ncbi:unnamed protein product [Schistocephalus solidus]|uniref:Uncharacterized protein n=1 Tax=Schistocephalus solidus TaxID=70667 RepID=A0A3P7BXH3_SCHSO|nr:unnamed protein product [Schistocephalus solidus]